MSFLPLIPFANAQLALIAGSGSSEDYDASVGAQTTKWSGSADAYVGEEVLDQVTGNRLDTLKQDYVSFIAGLADVQPDDYLTWTHAGVSVTRKVKTVLRREVLGTVVVHVWDA